MVLGQLFIFAFWFFGFLLVILGTIWTKRHLSKVPPYMDAPFNLLSISILKPLKGIDPSLKDNLESFFKLQYPRYEIIFSVADENDPAISLVLALMRDYPNVKAQLILGSVDIGPNPKVNNLIKSYEAAENDWLIVSDSNTRVTPDFLKRVVGHLDAKVGVMTAVVAGRHSESFGGDLESIYLNTFYARWMVIASRFHRPCVIGKCMVFKKSVANRFGGMRMLAKFIAEDYMTGEAMRMLGMRVVIMADPITQFIGRYDLSQFWKRHVRWGRIRRSHAPFLYFAEVFTGAVTLSLLGACASSHLFSIDGIECFLTLFSLHFLVDAVLITKLDGELSLKKLRAWLAREILMIPLWLHVQSGRMIEWRGQKLKLKRGGLVEVPQDI